MGELVDIYDEDARNTGRSVEREGAFMHEGEYLLYVLAILQDTRGRILITKRSEEKHYAAGWWEISGGGSRSGETSLQAVRREVREETGLTVPEGSAAPVYSYKNVDLERGDNYIVDIYRFQFDFAEDDITLQSEETVDFKLASWETIEALNDEGVFLHFKRLKTAIGL